MYDLILNATNPIPFVMVDGSGVEVAGLGGTYTVTLSKNGAGFGASAGTKAELAGGWYLYTATAGECNTAGPLALRITGAGCVQQNLVHRVAASPTTLGSGAIAHVYTLTNSGDGLPIPEAQVWVSTDLGGSNIVASGLTSTLGVVTFYLDAGTYYFWRSKSGFSFSEPDTEVVA